MVAVAGHLVNEMHMEQRVHRHCSVGETVHAQSAAQLNSAIVEYDTKAGRVGKPKIKP